MFRKVLYNAVIFNVAIVALTIWICLCGYLGGYIAELATEGYSDIGILIGALSGTVSLYATLFTYTEGY